MSADKIVTGEVVKVVAHKNRVILCLDSHTWAVLTIKGAHGIVTDMCEAIANAQGHQDVMDGKITDPSTCPRCKARNITARHACKKVT